jgi:hypothetical protein
MEHSAGAAYTGVKNTREDVSMSVPAYVVYQTEWVLMSGGGWEELGTANNPNGVRYWYWGWGAPTTGNWYELGKKSVGTGTRTFSINRTAGHTWHYVVDGIEYGTDSFYAIGGAVHVGAESYETTAAFSKYTHRSISRSINEGGWTLWTGFDGDTVDAPPMCGGWDYSYQWRAAENRAC